MKESQRHRHRSRLSLQIARPGNPGHPTWILYLASSVPCHHRNGSHFCSKHIETFQMTTSFIRAQIENTQDADF